VEFDADGLATARFQARQDHLSGLEWLRSRGGEILDIGQSEGSLEEYFVTAVAGTRTNGTTLSSIQQ
jgi:cyclopropane fatty-acyl-phospholipid synthase-like methyltransferase